MSFGFLFPPKYPRFQILNTGGTATGITTKQYTLTQFNPPAEGYYLVSVKGAITTASGLNNNNIHLIVSQNLTPTPSVFNDFAFQSMSEWNNGTSILAVSVCDTIKITGKSPVYVYLYDTQVQGGETYDFTWSAVKFAPISVFGSLLSPTPAPAPAPAPMGPM